MAFITKYRRRAFTSDLLTRYEEIMREVRTDFEAELKQSNGEEDHAHLLVHYPPKVQLSTLVNSLKGVSSRYLRKEYDTHIRRYLWGGHFWSGSSFAGSCGDAPLTVVRQYNENQQRPVQPKLSHHCGPILTREPEQFQDALHHRPEGRRTTQDQR